MTPVDEWLQVDSIDLDGQGVARNAAGKVVFIDGALAGESVQVHVQRRKHNWEQATLSALRNESALRVTPKCPHFGRCGGCKLQHLHVGGQVAAKQRAVEDALWHIGKLRPERVLRPIEGPAWDYRLRARLSVRHVARKGTVLVGFHERKSSYVTDMDSCEVMPDHVSRLLLPLRTLVGAMSGRDRIPQIEVAIGGTVTALVLRHLEPLCDGDLALLRAFAVAHRVQWWLQPKGPDTVQRLDTGGDELAYTLPEFGITMPFRPTDFTQVNHAINQVLVAKAIGLLEVAATHRVIDWFCGIGNFTLALARRAGAVLGVEGSASLVKRAAANAARNGLATTTAFLARNLFEITTDDLAAHGPADRWLIDPPREGALALVNALANAVTASAASATDLRPARIVYVSCNPATLARDAGILVHQAGYRCVAAGAVNMFPHTAHVESIAVFSTQSPTGA